MIAAGPRAAGGQVRLLQQLFLRGAVSQLRVLEPPKSSLPVGVDYWPDLDSPSAAGPQSCYGQRNTPMFL